MNILRVTKLVVLRHNTQPDDLPLKNRQTEPHCPFQTLIGDHAKDGGPGEV